MAEQGVLELATLGRPMQLGMLYDCRRDSLIPGLTLWDPAVLQNDRDVRPQPSTQYDIMSSDRVDDKASSLNISASLRASFLGGLIEVKGSAKFLHDKKSSIKQARLTLHYKTTTRFEQLTMKHLGAHNVQHSDIFDQGTATHVVTGILYGAHAFFVFDRDCTREEEIKDVQGRMHGMVKRIASFEAGGEGSLEEGGREGVDKMRCSFHGDFNLENNPASYQDAVSVYTKLPLMLGRDGEYAVPIRAWLYPLDKLDQKAAKLTRQISVNLISQSQEILEGLEDVGVKCDDMIMSDICRDFPQFREKFGPFKQKIVQYKLYLQEYLVQALPAIRGGSVEENTLADFIRNSVQSPFGLEQLNGWVTSKEKEMNVVKAYMKLFSGIQIIRSQADLDELVLDPLVSNAVCFVFPLDGPEQYFEALSQHLQSADGPASNLSIHSDWFADKSASANMRSDARGFAEFCRANAGAETNETVFAVTGFGADVGGTGSILLYEEGVLTTKGFKPPSKPGKPSIQSKTNDEVTLEWLPPEMGLSEVERYEVQYQETGKGLRSTSPWDWQKSCTRSDTRQITIQNLKPLTTYEFQVVAVCRVGVSQVSESSDPCTTLPAGPPIRVRKHAVSETCLTIVWDPPAVLGEGVQVENYVVRYTQVSALSIAGPNQDVVKSTSADTCLFIIDDLKPNEPYRIWVSAQCGSAGNGVESEPLEIATDQAHQPAKYAKRIAKTAEVLSEGCESTGTPTILKIPLDQHSTGSGGNYLSFSFGKKTSMVQQHKVIMVVGATGAGKSTLINGMINYILKVDWKDGFRFKIVDQRGEGPESQAHSQTQIISAYTVYENKHLNVPYTLTIIDTPGFGDTRGIERDRAIVDQIRDFFSLSEAHKVDHIDAIGFVAQSSQARLTHTQRYVFDSILSVFGKDISSNILLLVTFCDGQKPPVVDAVKEADIPCSNSMFKFNNSALFASNGISKGLETGGKAFTDTNDITKKIISTGCSGGWECKACGTSSTP
ncbi:stonustoxin subunit beta-like [Acanthaster planci]|uniref:Stonustoxin subunit beta-like n=1 Tax=Acanthaster planci TaxID=133434 RepID=A0A8B7ZX39_ACAPL|nr:stonustoxin subunit beta-like [Acanthaster planci]XP_022109330.1 stonustoxin subunit beta-like [Acanthaster planci]